MARNEPLDLFATHDVRQPPSDVVLLAPKSSLVVRADLHPAIQYLLLEAHQKYIPAQGYSTQRGNFPLLKQSISRAKQIREAVL